MRVAFTSIDSKDSDSHSATSVSSEVSSWGGHLVEWAKCAVHCQRDDELPIVIPAVQGHSFVFQNDNALLCLAQYKILTLPCPHNLGSLSHRRCLRCDAPIPYPSRFQTSTDRPVQDHSSTKLSSTHCMTQCHKDRGSVFRPMEVIRDVRA